MTCFFLQSKSIRIFIERRIWSGAYAATSIRTRHLRDGIWGWTGGTGDFDKDGRGVVERFSTISQAGNVAGIPEVLPG